MTALCRYLDADHQTQIGLFKTVQESSPQVCPLVELQGFESGDLLANNDSVVYWTSDRLARLGEPHQSMWQPAPTKMLSPVHQPEKIICIGLNYLDHAIETGSEPPDEPVVFGKFNNALIGHGDTIELPPNSDQVDYEAELVVVIGKTTRRVSQKEAMNHVFGYTAGHDVSARDWQKGHAGGQWLLGKSFDAFAPVGPAVVTSETFGDPSDIRIRMRLNDEIVQESTTAQLIFKIPMLISHLSHFMTLQPGDLIFTGTPPGVGAARTPPRFLSDGDRCSVEIDGIGALQNVCKNA